MVVIYFTDLAKERLLRIIKDSVKQKSYKQPWCTVLNEIVYYGQHAFINFFWMLSVDVVHWLE
jgi:hypothetical protein